MPDANATPVVVALYRAVLGRAPDPDGLEHYASELASGRLEPADVAAELATSREAPSGLARSPATRALRRMLWDFRVPPLEGSPIFVLHIMKTGGTSLIE